MEKDTKKGAELEKIEPRNRFLISNRKGKKTEKEV